MELILNPDHTRGDAYKIARVVYAETGATSLPLVEGFASMIANIARARGISPVMVVSDENTFGALRTNNSRHGALNVRPDSRAFQMCLRVVTRMLHGNLPDCCNGATRFHRDDEMPDWATSRGYIADIDGVLFYI